MSRKRPLPTQDIPGVLHKAPRLPVHQIIEDDDASEPAPSSSNQGNIREYRANLSDEQVVRTRQTDAAQHRHMRSQTSEEQRHQRREQNAASQRQHRIRLTDVDRQQIRVENAAQHRRRLNELTDEERQHRRERNAANMRRRRAEQQPREANIAQMDFMENNVQPFNVGKNEYKCFGCNALMFKGELHKGVLGRDAKFSMCCAYGSIQLPDIQPPPEELQHLLTSDDARSKEFRTHIRMYNSAVAFASIGVDFGSVFNFNNGPPVYKLNGQMYHSLGHILPGPGKKPQFSQLYVYDIQNELENRHNRNPAMNRATLGTIQTLMHEHNPFAQTYIQVINVCFIRPLHIKVLNISNGY